MKKNILSIQIFLLFIGMAVYLFACQKEEDLGAFTPKEPNLSFKTDTLKVSNINDSTIQIKVNSNLPWRVKTNNGEWITIKDSTSFGKENDSLITITIKKNPLATQRIGIIQAWITSDYPKTLVIVQKAGLYIPTSKKIYVKVGGTGDGSSWINATSLTGALSTNMNAGDSILVAAGTYTPTLTVTGGTTAAADLTFEIKENISIIGGYPANATSGAVADPNVNFTIFDGTNTANHVVTITAPVVPNKKVILRGLTIKNGNASVSGSISINGASYNKQNGAGIIVGQSVVDIKRCVISDNSATNSGGGVALFSNAIVKLDSCNLTNNKTTTGFAGGIDVETAAQLFVYNSSLTNNASGGFAGCSYIYNAKAYFYNTTIAGNGAGGLGSSVAGKAYGGLYYRESSGQIVNCTIYGNTASNIGGGVGLYGNTTVDIISSTITGNKIKHATAKGSGAYVNGNASSTTLNIYNTIVSGNTAGATGVETASDLDGATGYAYSKKNIILATQVFDNNGTVITGSSFDFTTMLGTLADNGGVTKTILLLGSTNPAKTSGMNTIDLTSLGSSLTPVILTNIIANDQIGGSRSSKPFMGACVK